MAIEVRSQLLLDAALQLAQAAPTGFVLENLSAAPTSPEPGRSYFDTTLSVARTWDGSQWIDLFHVTPNYGTVTAQTAFGASSGDGSSANVSRADHTHGTPTHNDAAHSAIHLSALAAPSANVDCGGKRFVNGADPVDDSDLATKNFVTQNSYGLDPHASVDLVLTNETLFSVAPTGEMTIDGVLSNNSRVLVAQPHPSGDPSTLYNGIWVTSSSTWSRASDADASGELTSGSAVYVSGGKVHKGELWACYGASASPWVPDTDAIYFTQFSSLSTTLAGVGLSRVGQRLDVAAGGVGIDLSSGLVSIDVDVVARKIVADIGDGSATSFVIDCTDIGGANSVNAQAWDITTGHAILCDFQRGVQNLTVSFDSAPSATSVRVVILG